MDNNNNFDNSIEQKIFDIPDRRSIEIQNTIESIAKIDNKITPKQIKEINKKVFDKPKLNKSSTEKAFFVYGKNSKQNNVSKEKRLLSANRKAQNLTSYDNKFSNKITKTFDKPLENKYSITYVDFENNFAEIDQNQKNRDNEKNKITKNSFFKKIIKQESKNNYFLKNNSNDNTINNNENTSNNNITVTHGINHAYIVTSDHNTFNYANLANNSVNYVNNISNTNFNNETNTNATNGIININSNNLNARKEKNFEKTQSYFLRSKGKATDFNGNTKESFNKQNNLFNSTNLNINNVKLNLKINEKNETTKTKAHKKIKIKNSNFDKKNFNRNKNLENNENNIYNTAHHYQTNYGIGSFASTNELKKIKTKNFPFRDTYQSQNKGHYLNRFNSTSGFEINKFRKENKTHSDNFITINHCNNG